MEGGREKDIYNLARARQRIATDIGQVSAVKDRDGTLLNGDYGIRDTWLGHFDYLLIGENERGDLEEVLPLQGLMEEIDLEEVIKQLDVDRIVYLSRSQWHLEMKGRYR